MFRPERRSEYAALSAIIGTSYFFVLRTAATFFQDFFSTSTVARVTSVMSMFATAALLYFFVSFYKYFLERTQSNLGKITRLVIICFYALLLLVIQRVLRVFDVAILSLLPRYRYYGLLIQWISSIFVLIFFVVFYRETFKGELRGLRKAAISAIIGSAIAAFIQTAALLDYYSSQSTDRLFVIPRDTVIFLLPIPTIAFVTMLYFFIAFYKAGITRESA